MAVKMVGASRRSGLWSSMGLRMGSRTSLLILFCTLHPRYRCYLRRESGVYHCSVPRDLDASARVHRYSLNFGQTLSYHEVLVTMETYLRAGPLIPLNWTCSIFAPTTVNITRINENHPRERIEIFVYL